MTAALAARLEALWRGERIAGAFAWLSAPSAWTAIAAALAGAGLLVLGPLFGLRGVYIASMPHDSLGMVEAGYRLVSGQIPGRDFYSAQGPLFQSQMGLALWMGGDAASALKLATLFFMIAAAAAGAYIARSRLSNLGALSVLFALLVLGAAPYAKADAYIEGVTFAMIYNRESWPLLTLGALFWLQPRRAPRPRLDAVVLALLVAACLYIKVSYGGVSLLFAAAWLGLRARRWDCAITFAATLAVCAAVWEAVFGFGFNLAYLRDILFVAHAGGGRIAHIAYNLYDARYELAVVGVFMPLVVWAGRRPNGSTYGFVLATAAAALLIIWQNAQIEGLVLLWAAVAALIEPALAESADGAPADMRFAPKALALYAAWLVLSVGPSVVAMGEYVAGSLHVASRETAIAMIAKVRFQPAKPGPLAPGVVDPDAFARRLETGVDLLSACPKSARVFTLDLFDPFAAATGRPPSRGWSWHDLGHSFSASVHPSAAAEFGDIGCVMIPRSPDNARSRDGLWSVYGDDIRRRYPVVLVNPDWILRLPAPSTGGR